jgi:hypothetical protein
VDILCNNGALKWDSVNQRIYADGTPEVLTVCGKNLLDPNAVVLNKYINANGQEVASTSTSVASLLSHTGFIPVTEGQAYTISVTRTINGSNTGAFNWFTSADLATIMSTRDTYQIDSTSTYYTVTATAPVGAKYLIVNFIIGDENQLETGSATAYEPYNPQTVTDIPMLFGVEGFADEVEIISGIKTSKVGVLVIDGTEGWTKYSSGNGIFFLDTDATFGLPNNCLCTHYIGVASTMGASAMPVNSIKCGYGTDARYNHRVYLRCETDTSLADLTAFLAAQYAAGTPVIVLYPLATETTEQTTPHELHSYAGDTTVSWTAAVEGTEKTVEYAQGETASNTVGTAKVGTAKAA